jgi:hypothetical protein
MSIAGISAMSLAGYEQQSKDRSRVGAGAQTTVEQAAAAIQVATVPRTGSTQQFGSAQRHAGDGTTTTLATQVTQAAKAGADGTNILNTLV